MTFTRTLALIAIILVAPAVCLPFVWAGRVLHVAMEVLCA